MLLRGGADVSFARLFCMSFLHDSMYFSRDPERQMVSETCLCLLSRQALRDGNKLAQMEEAPLFPGESIKAIGEFDLAHGSLRDVVSVSVGCM